MHLTTAEYKELLQRQALSRGRCRLEAEGVPFSPVSLPVAKSAKRIRQDTKPLMNKLEQEWFNHLAADSKITMLRPQALRFKLANGAWYKPDITGWVSVVPVVPAVPGPAVLTAWECKGPSQMKNVDRGMLALKCAAAQWPEIKFILVWKQDGVFRTQEVLP